MVHAESRMPDCLTEYKQCNATPSCKIDLHVFLTACEVEPLDLTSKGCFLDGCDNCRAAIVSLKLKWSKFLTCGCDSNPSRPLKHYQMCNSFWLRLSSHECVPYQLSGPCKTDESVEKGSKENQVLDNISQHLNPDSMSNDLLSRSLTIPTRIHDPILNGSLRLVLYNLGLEPSTEEQVSFVKTHYERCTQRLDECQRLPSCRRAMTHFKEKCTFDTCELMREQCTMAYDQFRVYGMFSCDCIGLKDPYQKHRCVTYQADFIDNKCIALLNTLTNYAIGSLSSSSPTKQKREEIVASSENCFTVFQRCSRDPTCLKEYLRLQRSCEWNEATDSCVNYQRCINQLRHFYSESRPLVYTASDCQCSHEEDIECQRHQLIFQPKCARRNHKQPNCLTLMSQCVESWSCLDTYTMYDEICSSRIMDLSNVKEKCLYSSQQCTDIKRALWGTVLTLNCSCDPGETYRLVHHDPVSKKPGGIYKDPVVVCNTFRETLRKPFCSKKKFPISNVDGKANYTDPCNEDVSLRHGVLRNHSRRVFESDDGCSYICSCPLIHQQSKNSLASSSSVCRLFHCPSYPRLHPSFTTIGPPQSSRNHAACNISQLHIIPSNDGKSNDCRCHEGIWFCRVSDSSLSSTFYFLKLNYNLQRHAALLEFHMKQSHLWNHSNPSSSYKESLENHLTTLLNDVIKHTTGLRHCQLQLYSPYNYSSTDIPPVDMPYTILTPIADNESLFYNLQIEFSSFSGRVPHGNRRKVTGSNSMRENILTSSQMSQMMECVNSIHLLQAMLQHSHPEFRFSPSLSILTSSKLYQWDQGISSTEFLHSSTTPSKEENSGLDAKPRRQTLFNDQANSNNNNKGTPIINLVLIIISLFLMNEIIISWL